MVNFIKKRDKKHRCKKDQKRVPEYFKIKEKKTSGLVLDPLWAIHGLDEDECAL